MAGPFCGQVLADMGADVIKVEPPGRRPDARFAWASTPFRAVNRNKRSLDARPQGRRRPRVLHRLARERRRLLENYRPGVAARLGADYETLRAINPRLIYASISGFGQTGPYAQRPGFDLIAQGLAGVMSVTGEPDGDPVKCGIPIGDLSAGLFCAVGILSRAARRERTARASDRHLAVGGRARALDLGDGRAVGDRPRAAQLGSAHRLTAPYQALRTATATSPSAATTRSCASGCARRSAATTCRRPALRHQRRPHGQPRRAGRRARAALAARGTDEWVDALLEAGVPAGPIHDYAAGRRRPAHAGARDGGGDGAPRAGTVRALGIPVKLSATPGTIRRPAPLLGQHSDEIRASSTPMADVTLERRGVAAWVTFDRPEAHNAMTFAMYDRLVEHCETVDADDRDQGHGPARRGRQGVRRRHRHPPVRGVQVRSGRPRLRGPDR
jgi:formyl-CoA transferase